jgi:arylformamidase
MTLIDISRTLDAAIAVWPGDTPFQLIKNLERARGSSVNLTTLHLSAHTGTHADAPLHFTDTSASIDAVTLDKYWGIAQVMTVTRLGALAPEDFAAVDLTLAPRLLVRSPAASQPHHLFPEAISYPSPAVAALLGAHSVVLYGSDGPSMDAVDSADLPGHNALLQHGIAILEGLDLRNAPDGLYELVALPLKIAGGDGSPVRAVLRSL